MSVGVLVAMVAAGPSATELDSALTAVHHSGELMGVVSFAASGALVAVRKRLDLFGMAILATATALGGGIVRDLLIGDVPPAALRSMAYPVVALGGGIVVILAHTAVAAAPAELLVVLDAAGLGLFAVTGAAKALDHRMNALLAVLLGTITGVGGGVIRDVLLDQVPAVLRVDVYAVAAAAGATATVVADRAGLPRAASMTIGAVVCVVLRLIAHALGWQLPRLVT